MSKALELRILDRWRSTNGRKPKPDHEPVPPWLLQLDKAGLPRHLIYPSTTLGRVFDQTADRFGNATALIYGEKAWTYSELLAQVNRMAGGLASLGVRRGDRVLLTLPNCPEFVITFFALQKLGAVAVNAGPLMGADDLQRTITMTTPRVTVGLDLQSPLLLGACHGSTVQHSVWVTLQLYQTALKRLGYRFKLWQRPSSNGDRIDHTPLGELLAKAPSRPPTIEADTNALAVLQPTGGTTGTLKLVQLSHKNLIANAAQVAVWMGSRIGQERHLAVLPMFHVYGLTTELLTSVYTGASMVMATRFAPRETVELIRKHHPTLLLLVPAICHALSDALEREEKPAPFEGVRLCVSGAAPLSRDVAERFTRICGVPVVEGYGLTEAGPVTHVNLPGNPRMGTIGLPLPDTRVRVVDLENGTTDVARGETGEMLISGPQVMSGYFANPKETEKALSTDEHGVTWLHTGDVVRVDGDGFFYVADRKKDMIIRSGMKVYPLKVETALRAHEKVADAAVIGRPDPVHTEVVVAFVARKNSQDDIEALSQDLRAHCRQHLAAYEVPAVFEFIDAIPRSALGKVLKHELRARLASQPEKPTPEPEKPQPIKPGKAKEAA
ncbi:MAG TPA: AMP-binding protein [Tepidisphaeraceae bacterium]|jgi:long-chain acyl-CoA synthetase|nr:AMP-binding protein [Tepidisphaeraceae bacterium]